MSVPKLVIGDHFASRFQLITSTLPSGYDITAAESIRATVVNEDHSKRLCEVVEQTPTEDDDVARGQITVQFNTAVTEQLRAAFIRAGYAWIELQVVINARPFTWFHDVEVVPGYID